MHLAASLLHLCSLLVMWWRFKLVDRSFYLLSWQIKLSPLISTIISRRIHDIPRPDARTTSAVSSPHAVVSTGLIMYWLVMHETQWYILIEQWRKIIVFREGACWWFRHYSAVLPVLPTPHYLHSLISHQSSLSCTDRKTSLPPLSEQIQLTQFPKFFCFFMQKSTIYFHLSSSM